MKINNDIYNRKISLSSLISILLLISLSGLVFAIPDSLTLQGKLTDLSGSSQEGTFNFTFKIYDAYTGGNALYQIINTSVTTDANGIYDIILHNLSSLNFSDQYYLGIAVQGDDESQPRINLTSSPYSFRANISEDLNKENKYEIAELNITGSLTVAGEIITASTNISILYGNDGTTNIPLLVTSTGALVMSVVEAGVTTTLDVGSTGVDLTLTGDFTVDSPTFFVDSTNNLVGIGTITPATKLDVQGKLNITGNTSIAQDTLFVDNTSSRVGIGTASPSQELEVAGYINVTGTGTSNSTFQGDVNIIGLLSGASPLKITGGLNVTSGDIIFPDGSTQATSASGGSLNSSAWNRSGTNVFLSEVNDNVGIGTTTPDSTLTVNGNVNVSGTLNVTGTISTPTALGPTILDEAASTTNPVYAFNTDEDTGIGLQSAGILSIIGDGKEILRITERTNNMNQVGVIGGTSVEADADGLALSVTGTLNDEIGAGTFRALKVDITTTDIRAWDNVYLFDFLDSGTSRMVLTSAGNVGIGTTTPATTLDVQGDANVSGTLSVGSFEMSNAGAGTMNVSGDTLLAYNSGSVGIGTKNPAMKLVVVGNVNVSENLTVKKIFTDNKVSDGLVLNLHFDNNTAGIASGQTLIDDSGYGNDGTGFGTDGPNWTTGKFGSALVFDGVDDYVDAGSDASLVNPTAMTVSVWVKPKSKTSNQGVIVKQTHTGIDNPPYAIQHFGGSDWSCDIEADDSSTVAAGGGTIDLNVWQYIVLTFGDSTLSCYKNGVLQNTGSLNNITDGSSSLFIGQQKDGTNRFFNGTIDEVRIYKRALTADEIKAHYTTGIWEYGSGGIGYVDGNVGINTTTPAQTLTVQGTLNVTADTTAGPNLFVASDGNVGIGTTSPNYKLVVDIGNVNKDVAEFLVNNTGRGIFVRPRTGNVTEVIMGAVDVDDQAVGLIRFTNINHSQSNGDIQLWVRTAGNAFTLKDSGNVGIGTTSPARKLHVNGTNQILIAIETATNATTEIAGIEFRGLDNLSDSTVYARINSNIVNSTNGSESGEILFFTNDAGTLASNVRINADGELIISSVGATFGGEALSVGRSDATTPDVFILRNLFTPPVDGESISTKWTFRTNVSSGSTPETVFAHLTIDADNITNGTEDASLRLQLMNDGSFNQVFTIKGTGKVGIGTITPTENLVIMGNLSINHSAGTSTALFVDSTSGNVGIGTTTPATTLDVQGDANISGTLSVGSFQLGSTSASTMNITGEFITFTGENGSLFQPVYGTDDDLVLYLPFSEASLDTSTQFDRSPFGNDGTVSGAICNSTSVNQSTGRYGGACFFDGTNDYVNVSDSSELRLTTGGTLEAWIHPLGLGGGDNARIIEKNVADANGYEIRMSATNQVTFKVANTGSISSGTNSVPFNQWSHVAGTFDSSGRKLYVNGELVATTTTNDLPGDSAGDIHIGRWDTSNARNFDGSIDEVRIYKRALAPEEIRTHYLRGSGFGASGAITADKFRIVNTSGSKTLELNQTTFEIYNVNGSDLFVVNRVNGSVGIGTSSPRAELDVRGSIMVSDGSATSPALTFSSDTDTGIYLKSAGTLAISSGGIEKVQIGPSGVTFDVGIVPSSGGGQSIGGSLLEWSTLFLSNGIEFARKYPSVSVVLCLTDNPVLAASEIINLTSEKAEASVPVPTCSNSCGLVVPIPTLPEVPSTNKTELFTVKFWLTLTFPATTNFIPGEVVPIPTLPDEVAK